MKLGPVILGICLFLGKMPCMAQHSGMYAMADFTAPDTVVVGEPVQITNQTVGGSTFFWNFCPDGVIGSVSASNIGNPSQMLGVPTYITLVQDGQSHYSFICDQQSGSIIRNYHGDSYLNDPQTSVDLGNLGVLGNNVEGIQIKKVGGLWYGFVCNGNSIVRLDFGGSLTNVPVPFSLGAGVSFNMPHALSILQDNGEWVGFLTCSWGNNFARLRFGNSLTNIPIVDNFGAIGGISLPFGFNLIQDGANWYALILSSGTKSLVRLDFGSSLLNSPTLLSPVLLTATSSPVGLMIVRDCKSISAFVTDYVPEGYANLLYKVTFPSGITGPGLCTGIGAPGWPDKPHSFSENFRVGDVLYTYFTNRGSSSLTRFAVSSCLLPFPPSSVLFNPPVYTYSAPGTYLIQLIVDEGTPTQTSLCKQIVVTSKSSIVTAEFSAPDTICSGDLVTLVNSSSGGTDYNWSFCKGDAGFETSGKDLGNPQSLMNIPAFCTLVKSGNECYSFITDRGSHAVIRNGYGTSFMNAPGSTTLLNVPGVLTGQVSGIQIVEDQNQWYGFICNGKTIVRLNFGASLLNNPVVTVLGPYTLLDDACGLVFGKDGSSWIAMVSNPSSNTIIRVSFPDGISSNPILTSLGNPGGLLQPGAMKLITETGKHYLFVVNMQNSSLTRLNFGSSLYLTPTGTNLGQVASSLASGIMITRNCNSLYGYVFRNVPAGTAGILRRIDFPDGIEGPVVVSAPAPPAGLDRPFTSSETFFSRDSIYTYVVNQAGPSVYRFGIPFCSSSMMPPSTAFQPPPFIIDTAGTYRISLIVNSGTPSETVFCHNIMVLAPPPDGHVDTTICNGEKYFTGGQWQTTSGIYYDTIQRPLSCDSVVITQLHVLESMQVSLGNDTSVCRNVVLLMPKGTTGTYTWQDGSHDSVYLVNTPGTYWVSVAHDGCSVRDTVHVWSCDLPLWFPNVFTPNSDGVNDYFHPVGYGVLDFHMYIFNRWGEQIFETENLEPGWDGTFHGRECSDGVYFYISDYRVTENGSGTHTVKGSVTLLK